MWWFVFFMSVLIAALIGGLTNHFAIKMLFHPRQAKYWFGVRIPFTPGIIPKRRAEIAQSFGQIVSTQLITSDAINRWINSDQFQVRIQSLLDQLLFDWSTSGLTIKQLLSRFQSAQQIDELQNGIENWVKQHATTTVREWWNQSQVGAQPLAYLLGERTQERSLIWSKQLVTFAAREAAAALQSEQGERFLKSMVGELVEKMSGGGFLGNMISGFLNVDSLTVKLREALLQKMNEEQVRDILEQWMSEKVDGLLQMKLDEGLQFLAGKDSWEWIESSLLAHVEWKRIVSNVLEYNLGDAVRRQEELSKRITFSLAQGVQSVLAKKMDDLLETLQLAKIVEEQIASFPVERIERMILDVSGREFRAITWLGAVLGGLIGIVQFLLIQFLRF
jgi:uncharacterized membrane protein YheB (UPF0754 family)